MKEGSMRRLVTLILLAADIFLAVQIYRGYQAAQNPLSGAFFRESDYAHFLNDSDGYEDSSGNDFPTGPNFFSGSTTPTGQVTLGGNNNRESTQAKTEDYGTEDPAIISRFQEFDWYRRNIGGYGSETITDPSEILGSYHAYVLFDPDNANNAIADLLADMRIEAGQNGTLVHMDWKYMYYRSEEAGEKDDSVSDFTGTLSDGKLSASGPGTLVIDRFFREDGTIRATGTMKTDSGILARIALEKH